MVRGCPIRNQAVEEVAGVRGDGGADLALGSAWNAVVFSVMNTNCSPSADRVRNRRSLSWCRRFSILRSRIRTTAICRGKRNRTSTTLITYNIMGPAGLAMGGDPKTVLAVRGERETTSMRSAFSTLGRFLPRLGQQGEKRPYIVLSYATWTQPLPRTIARHRAGSSN